MSEKTTTTVEIPACRLYELTARVRVAAVREAAELPVLTYLKISVTGGVITAVATDRFRLFLDSITTDSQASGEFLLPATAAEDFERAGFAGNPAPVELSWGPGQEPGTVVSVTGAGAGEGFSYTVAPMDFPRVDALLAQAIEQADPAEAAATLACFNPDFLADLAKVARIGMPDTAPVHLYPTAGGRQLLVTVRGTDFWGLLMGMLTAGEDQTASVRQALGAARDAVAAL